MSEYLCSISDALMNLADTFVLYFLFFFYALFFMPRPAEYGSGIDSILPLHLYMRMSHSYPETNKCLSLHSNAFMSTFLLEVITWVPFMLGS